MNFFLSLVKIRFSKSFERKFVKILALSSKSESNFICYRKENEKFNFRKKNNVPLKKVKEVSVNQIFRQFVFLFYGRYSTIFFNAPRFQKWQILNEKRWKIKFFIFSNKIYRFSKNILEFLCMACSING